MKLRYSYQKHPVKKRREWFVVDECFDVPICYCYEERQAQLIIAALNEIHHGPEGTKK